LVSWTQAMSKNAGTFTREISEMLDFYRTAAQRTTGDLPTIRPKVRPRQRPALFTYSPARSPNKYMPR
jgi:hypothetical protein